MYLLLFTYCFITKWQKATSLERRVNAERFPFYLFIHVYSFFLFTPAFVSLLGSRRRKKKWVGINETESRETRLRVGATKVTVKTTQIISKLKTNSLSQCVFCVIRVSSHHVSHSCVENCCWRRKIWTKLWNLRISTHTHARYVCTKTKSLMAIVQNRIQRLNARQSHQSTLFSGAKYRREKKKTKIILNWIYFNWMESSAKRPLCRRSSYAWPNGIVHKLPWRIWWHRTWMNR